MKIKSFGLVLLDCYAGIEPRRLRMLPAEDEGEATPPAAPEQKTVVAPEQKEQVVVKKESAPRLPQPAWLPRTDDIYFDFDKYNIRPGDAEILKKDYA